MTLTKKDAFSWTPEATKAFEQLKEVMCKAPVLTTPDFTKTFIVECDASGNGIGDVLMQEGRPLTFESRPLKGKDLHKPTYEKEIMEILYALKKWHPYLIGRNFKVKTDHDSLKYFLEQRLSSEEQQKWVTKILGYDFEIICKKGKTNVVVDALSRKDEDVEAFLYAISIIQPNWIIEERDEWKNDEKVQTLIQRLQQDSSASDTFTWKNDSLWYKYRLYLCYIYDKKIAYIYNIEFAAKNHQYFSRVEEIFKKGARDKLLREIPLWIKVFLMEEGMITIPSTKIEA
jgi:hypothetical protein